MSVDEIFARVYDLINMLELMPYIRAGVVVMVTVAAVRGLFAGRG